MNSRNEWVRNKLNSDATFDTSKLRATPMFELAGSCVVNMSIVGIITSQLSVISLLMRT